MEELWVVCVFIRSDEGLTLERSGLKVFMVANL